MLYLCLYSKDVHRTKWQALTIARLTHSLYTEIARIRCYTMLSIVFKCQDIQDVLLNPDLLSSRLQRPDQLRHPGRWEPAVPVPQPSRVRAGRCQYELPVQIDSDPHPWFSSSLLLITLLFLTLLFQPFPKNEM